MRPVPQGATFAYMHTPDGVDIRYARWEGDADKPTIVFLNGFRECIEKHFETVEDLQKRGYAVYTMDWRGQGLSTRALPNRQKVHIENFDLHVQDLVQLMNEVVRPMIDGAVYLFAHSMGGHLALRYLHDEPLGVDGAILCAPLFGFGTMPGTDMVGTVLSWGAGIMGKSKGYAISRSDYGPGHRQFDGNKLTKDPDRFEEEHRQLDANPALRMGGPTWGWLRAASRSVRTIRDERYLKTIVVPVFIIQAGSDTVVRNAAQKWSSDRMKLAHLFCIEGSAHEILRELDVYRDHIWALFDRYFEEQL
jgi:lysophospholipase